MAYSRMGPTPCVKTSHPAGVSIGAKRRDLRLPAHLLGKGLGVQLFLSADGEDLRGEDRLTGLPGAGFAVRFHLHPSVQASLVRDTSAALLRCPSGIVWRLRAAGAQMSLGESIYLGSGEARKSQQLVLSGTVPPGGAMVRWAIRREPKRAVGDQPAEEQTVDGRSTADE